MTPEERDRLATVEQEMRDVRSDIHEIKEAQKEQAQTLTQISRTLAEARGGWKTLLLLCAFAGGAGALIAKLVPFLR